MRRGFVLLAVSAMVAGCSASRHTAAPPTRPPVRHAHRHRVVEHVAPRLSERTTGALPAALQDGAGARVGGHAVVLGGLNAADVSTDGVLAVSHGGAHTLARLPGVLHDAAAVELGGSVYLFGGGNGTRQLDAVVRFDPRSARVATVGSLPAPSSDQSAAVVDGTAYVVGGYTGAAWLDTIVAWRPGRRARIVAHLPTPLRYAATSAADGRLVIAGGSLPDGGASRTVYAYEPGVRKLRRIGVLPAPTTHAAAAALDDAVYVLGGRGAATGTPTARVVSIDPDARKAVRPAGALDRPLSDATAVSLARGILVVGGRTQQGTTDTISVLRAARGAPRTARTPKLVDASNVYAADARGMLSPVVKHDPPYVYVPNSVGNTVDVIDQRTFKVVRHFAVGVLPQHVVPSYDLRTLYVTNDESNSLTVVDPRTGERGRTIPVADPYNMYFTPDGRYAIVVAERLHRLDFRDAHTFRLVRSLDVSQCVGVDHVDFSADGSYLVASCEFSGRMIEVDLARERVVGVVALPPGSTPQDVKLSPDGRVFYVADTHAGGVWELTGRPLRRIGFLATGAGAHGLYPSRDARELYVSNRNAGTVSVISFATRRVLATWRIAGGGSPDMGGVSADGKVLWLTGRYSSVVYALSTKDGRLLARIPVGAGPHGACVWPQPGRYSLGHTGILR